MPSLRGRRAREKGEERVAAAEKKKETSTNVQEKIRARKEAGKRGRE